MTDLFPISLADQIAEIDRELEVRLRVYPRWVQNRKISQEVAERRCAILKSARDSLKSCDPNEREHLLAGMANLGQRVEELERERDLALAEARRAGK